MRQSFFFKTTVLIVLAKALFSQALADIPHFSILSYQAKVNLQEDYTVIYKVFQKTLILDQKGLGHGSVQIPYSDLHRIMSFEGRLIDPIKGKVLKKITAKDLSDRTNVSSGTLFEDDRVKYYGLGEEKLPLIVEWEYEIRQSGNFYFIPWYPLNYYNQKVEKTSLEINYPEKLGLRYRLNNFSMEVDSIREEGNIRLNWELSDLDPIDKLDKNQVKSLKIYPVKFSLEGYEADMSNWEDFGLWFSQLMDGKDEIPESLRKEVIRLTQNLDQADQKIESLYKYLQNNYRYVNIALGIGGWMPKEAKEVYSLKYAECKGLTNLMRAMLKEVGIVSQYALVKAGDEEEDIDIHFPSNQFNHAFLRIPLEDQIIWLECTSNASPVGYLGDFTKNRHALVITEKGGFIEKTPTYASSEFNTSISSSRIKLKEDGNAEIEGQQVYKGNEAAKLMILQKNLELKDQKTYLNKNLGGSGLQVSKYRFEEKVTQFVPIVHVDYSGEIQKYAQQTSKRAIIPINWRKINKEALLDGNFLIVEEIELHLPQNFSPDTELPNLLVQEEGLHYFLETTFLDGVIKMNKRIEVSLEGKMNTEKSDWILQKINSISNNSIILKKPE